MVDLWRLRRMTAKEIGTREAYLCLVKAKGIATSDEQLEFELLGKVKRERHLEAVC